MQNILTFIITILIQYFLYTNITYANDLISREERNLSFIENKGQWEDKIKYKAEIPGGSFFLTDEGFVYNFYSPEDIQRIENHTCGRIAKGLPEKDISNEVIRHHAYKVNFFGANADVQYQPEVKRNYYHNYFIGNDSHKWVGGVGLFEKVVQRNVYDGIDVAIYSTGVTLKYDFIVSPGADIEQISLSFDGVIPQLTVSGHLKITTSVNEVLEQAPYSYQIIDGKTVAIKCTYKLKDGRVTFDLPEGYNKRYPLIIDPSVVFVTFSGSIMGSYSAFSSTFDFKGNLYAGSRPNAGKGWPVTIGAFQNTIKGEEDIAINKFNRDGTDLLFSTFFGGSNSDVVISMICNQQNELVIVGVTESMDLPTSNNCYDNTHNGENDLFIAYFSEDGTTLKGATYIGGSRRENNDGNLISGFYPLSRSDVKIDAKGDLWICSNTVSHDFPVTSNAFQTYFSSGNTGNPDVVLFNLSKDLSTLLYSTFLGGNRRDVVHGLVIDQNGDIIICGGTNSEDFPTTREVISSSFNGDVDGFVSKFSPQGQLINSTYIGTSNQDFACKIDIDNFNNIYILGGTLGDYPISQSVFSIKDGDVYIEKLSSDLKSRLLTTRIGLAQKEFYQAESFIPSAFLVDNCGSLYIAGLTTRFPTKNLPLTSNAIPYPMGSERAYYFCVLSHDFMKLEYATYFGTSNTDHHHDGTHNFDKQGILYYNLCVYTSLSTTNYPGPSNAIFPKPLIVALDNMSFKFDFQLAIPVAKLDIEEGYEKEGCSPFSVEFVNMSSSADKYIWDFGDGTPSVTVTTLQNMSHTYVNPGVYKVSLVAWRDSIPCNINGDTAYTTIIVHESNLPSISVHDAIICDTQLVSLSVEVLNPRSTYTYKWLPSNGIIGPDHHPKVLVDPNLNAEYYILVSDTGLCGQSIIDTIKIKNLFKDLMPDLKISNSCINSPNGGASLLINPEDTTSKKIMWCSATDTTILSNTDSLINVPSGNYYVRITTSSGCDTTLYFYIPEEDYQVSVSASDTIVCVNDPISFYNHSENHFHQFQWDFGDGNTSTVYEPQHRYQDQGTYKVTLIGEGAICTDTAYINIEVDTPVNTLTFEAEPEEICMGETIYFYPKTDPSTTRLTWSFGDGSGFNTGIQPVQHAYDQPGVMYVQLNASFRACPDISFTDTVLIHPFPKIDLGVDSVLCLHGKPIILQNLYPHVAGYQYTWSNGSTEQQVKVVHHGTYTLTITNEQGCAITESVQIDKDCFVDIPNAFTPNGDGMNDYFFPRQYLTKSVVSFQFRIFNRWGQVIFETTNTDGRGWDGKFNGMDQPVGAYIYLLDVTFDNGRVEQYKGNVTLLR